MTPFHIPDMSCGHCKSTVAKTLHALDPEARVEFDMAARKVSVESKTEASEIVAALAKIGFPASPA